MNEELTELPLHVLSAGIAARQFSPVDVVEAYLGRIAALEPRLQAFVSVYGNDARLAGCLAAAEMRLAGIVRVAHGLSSWIGYCSTSSNRAIRQKRDEPLDSR